VSFFESATLFGAALLVSVLPLVILVSSLANHRIDTDISRHIGLNRQGAGVVSQLFRSSPSHSAADIVTGLIFAAVGTVTVASSLQVIYERIFGQPHRGWQDILRFITWVGVLFGVLVADSVTSGSFRIVVTPVGVAVFSLMVWFIAIGAIIVLGATAGAVWAEHHAEHAAGHAEHNGDRGALLRRTQSSCSMMGPSSRSWVT
jgi:uncharacterized BrkB/YihY/UPF0761 family membrane protein